MLKDLNSEVFTFAQTALILRKKFIIATRPSQLATTQTGHVLNMLQEKNPDREFELKAIKTEGDRDYHTNLTNFAGIGIFVKELEQALYDGVADMAVHSLKDVPSLQPEGLTLASFPERQNPTDTVLFRENVKLEDLKSGSIVGTGSPRRQKQLKLLNPNIHFKEIRGNIETRIRKLSEGPYDAIVLASAGMGRMQIQHPYTQILDAGVCVPAPGQGTLAIECRSDDKDVIKIAGSISNSEVETRAIAERIFMRVIEGGCKIPLGAHAVIKQNRIHFSYFIGQMHGKGYLKGNEIFDLNNFEKNIEIFSREIKQKFEKL